MLEKHLKMILLQVFSEMTTQRSGFGQNTSIADEQARVLAALSLTNTLFLRFS